VKALVDLVKQTDPAVVDELNGANITLAEVQRVLQDLLDDRVAIRDLVRILEAIGERGRMSREPEQLLEGVRAAIGPAISGAHAVEGRLSVITIDPLTEQGMLGTLVAGADGSFLGIEPEAAEALGQLVLHEVTRTEQTGVSPVLVCSTQLRPALARLVHSVSPNLAVLSYAEIGPQLTIETVGTVNLGHTANV
jgi:flagellar biosynthesis protein FlhA